MATAGNILNFNVNEEGSVIIRYVNDFGERATFDFTKHIDERIATALTRQRVSVDQPTTAMPPQS